MARLPSSVAPRMSAVGRAFARIRANFLRSSGFSRQLLHVVSDWADIAAHVARTTGLPLPAALRVVQDVAAFFREPAEVFVRRRHRELQTAGMANPEIFAVIEHELATRPVAAPELTERQIRRVIYG